MRKTLRSIITAGKVGLAGLAALLPMKRAEAQIKSGSVEYITPKETANSYGRLNISYGLPEGINGFSFIELYKNGGGYFGRTALDKSLIGRLGIRAHTIYNGEPCSEVGFGPSVPLPMPKNAFARISLLPMWVGHEAGMVGDKAELQYAAGVSLPRGIDVSSFGISNLLGKGGPQWMYGEIEATADLGEMLKIDALKGIKVGYNPALLNNDGAVPKVQHRAIAGVKF